MSGLSRELRVQQTNNLILPTFTELAQYAEALESVPSDNASSWNAEREATLKGELLGVLGEVGLKGADVLTARYNKYADIELVGYDRQHWTALARGRDDVYFVGHAVAPEPGGFVRPYSLKVFLHERLNQPFAVDRWDGSVEVSVDDVRPVTWSSVRQEVIEVAAAVRAERLVGNVLALLTPDILGPVVLASGAIDKWHMRAERTVVIDDDAMISIAALYRRKDRTDAALQLAGVSLALTHNQQTKEKYSINADTLDVTSAGHDDQSSAGLAQHTKAEQLMDRVLTTGKST